jgi:hypothetical protein
MMTGSSPTLQRWPDGKTSVEKFLNLRAEIWWCLRVRFEKAYEFREKGIPHPVEQMISIPDCPRLIAELSQCLKEYTNTGKLKVESKDDMRARGVASPDHADALGLCFAPSTGEMTVEVLDVPMNRSFEPHADSAQKRRGYYGRT